jgi:hypothetical protein
MKPVTSQDTKWTRPQTTQGPKHQHAKLRGLWCLATRLTQSGRYSFSPEQHDLSVHIRRLKWPLMEKFWQPKFWASTIPLIWTCGTPNSDKGARRYGPEIPATQSVRDQNRLSSKADLEILSSFPGKEMNAKVEDNFVAHNLDNKFALFGVRTWEIWRRQGSAANQENLDEAGFMQTKFASLPRRISCKARWSTPQGTQGHK